MTCQCQIFEVCPECVPPEEYTRISRMRDRTLAQMVEPVTTERRYTLVELETLMRQFTKEQEGNVEMLDWTISILLEYLKKREREVGDGQR